MTHAVDTSALLNLLNGKVISQVARLRGVRLAVGQYVLDEAVTAIAQIGRHLEYGELLILDETKLSARRFVELKNELRLGDGETECIQAAIESNLVVVTDDGAARKAAVRKLGESSVVGSIGLLRECIQQGLISRQDALVAVHEMRKRGAYFPSLSPEKMFPL